MKKENWLVIIAGVLVGVAALVLTKLGNPANMAFASPASSVISPVPWACTVLPRCSTSALRSSV